MNQEGLDRILEKIDVADRILVVIGDVLSQPDINWNKCDMSWTCPTRGYITNLGALTTLWMKCGVGKSLQQIVLESGWEKVVIPVPFQKTERLKDKNAQALFKFLLDTFK